MGGDADRPGELQAANEPTSPQPAARKRRAIAEISSACSAAGVWFVGLLEPGTKIAINAGILPVIVFGGPLLYKMVTQPNFVIKNITVLGSLSDRGVTDDVITQQTLSYRDNSRIITRVSLNIGVPI